MQTRGAQFGASIAHSIGATSAREGWGSVVGFPLVSVYYVNTYYRWLQSHKQTHFSFAGLTESALFDTVTTRHFVTAFTFYEAKWKSKLNPMSWSWKAFEVLRGLTWLAATERVRDIFILTQGHGTPVGFAILLCPPIEWAMLNGPQEEVVCWSKVPCQATKL